MTPPRAGCPVAAWRTLLLAAPCRRWISTTEPMLTFR